MTLKQAIKRYLKEYGLYGIMSNDLRKISGDNAVSIFYIAQYLCDIKHVFWTYKNKSFYNFVSDWLFPDIDIKHGDIIRIKTQDGKYEFEHIAFEFWRHSMKIQLENGGFVGIERVSQINGKKVNFKNGCKFKRSLVTHIYE